nr:DUF6391 domain-containing protein [Ardenticatena sp.]
MFWWFLLAFFLVLFFVPILVLVLLPLGLTAHSIAVLLTAIPQLLAVARDRQRRRHHALEHATINVLEERAGASLPISGLAVADGFYISGLFLPPTTIRDAAEEALARLERGETHLALHPRCGTTVVAGQLLFALTLLLVFLFWPEWFWLGMLLALGIAMSGARPLSMMLQRFLTTDANVRGLAISHVEPLIPASIGQFLWIVSAGSTWKVVVVETSRPSARRVPFDGAHGRYRAF